MHVSCAFDSRVPRQRFGDPEREKIEWIHSQAYWQKVSYVPCMHCCVYSIARIRNIILNSTEVAQGFDSQVGAS